MSESYRNFIEDLENNSAPDTVKTYKERFKDLMNFYGLKNADRLAELPKKELEQKVHAFIRSKGESGKGYSYLNQAVSAVRRFSLANQLGLDYDWLYSKIPKPEVTEDQTQKEQDLPYSQSQLDAVFGLAIKEGNWRAVCSMGMMYTGGARIGALSGLHLEPKYFQYVDKYDVYAIMGYPESAKHRYWIITAPWLKPFIDLYKNDRDAGKFFVSHTDGEPIKNSALIREVWRLMISSKVRIPKGSNLERHTNMLNHGFRKAHSTALEIAGIHDDHIARLRGRKDRLAKTYQLPTPTEIIESTDYMKAVSRLQIGTLLAEPKIT